MKYAPVACAPKVEKKKMTRFQAYVFWNWDANIPSIEQVPVDSG